MGHCSEVGYVLQAFVQNLVRCYGPQQRSKTENTRKISRYGPLGGICLCATGHRGKLFCATAKSQHHTNYRYLSIFFASLRRPSEMKNRHEELALPKLPCLKIILAQEYVPVHSAHSGSNISANSKQL
jgi:hypothetical protein